MQRMHHFCIGDGSVLLYNELNHYASYAQILYLICDLDVLLYPSLYACIAVGERRHFVSRFKNALSKPILPRSFSYLLCGL